MSGVAVTALGWAVVNEKLPADAPCTSRSVCTLTVSPGANGCAGSNVEPSPFEYAVHVPSWLPDRAPLTLIAPMSAGATPRKLIAVRGFAKWLPGAGDTVTGCVAVAARARAAGPATTINDATSVAAPSARNRTYVLVCPATISIPR